MYNNLIYFEKQIDYPNSIGLRIYTEHVASGVIYNPIIFCDKYTCDIKNIPIFHTFYIKNLFDKRYILTNKFDTYYLIDMGLSANIIVIYDGTIETGHDKIISYDYNSNSFTKFLESACYEKI